MRLAGDDDADIISADETSLDRKYMHVSAFCQLKTEFPGLDIQGIVETGSKRCHTEMPGVEIEENVVHAGVADHGHVNDFMPLDMCLSGGFPRELIDTVYYGTV